MRRLAVLIICACAFPVTGARAWTWPVDGPVLRPFAFDHAHPYAGGQHRGVDLGAPSGSPVLAPAKGIVSFAGTVPTGGKTVSIETAFGFTATLVHLGSIAVVRGAVVGEGSVVGTVGPSGVVDLPEPYVYFGTRVTSDPQGYVDPLTLLPSRVAPTPSRAAEPAVAAVPLETREAAPEATVSPSPASEPSSNSERSTTESTAVSPSHEAAAVEPTIASGQATMIRPQSSRVAPDVAAPESVTPVKRAEVRPRSRAASVAAATPLAKVQLRRARASVRDAHVVQAQRSERQTVDSRRAGIPRTSPRSAGGSWRLPAGLAVGVTAALLALRRRLRRKPLDTLPIMDSGEQLLHHDTDLLRQLDASYRPRVHDDRGRHPHAPSQAARRRDVLLDGNGRARLQGLPGGRRAGARPEDLRRPDRRSLERVA